MEQTTANGIDNLLVCAVMLGMGTYATLLGFGKIRAVPALARYRRVSRWLDPLMIVIARVSVFRPGPTPEVHQIQLRTLTPGPRP